jgi:serine/threonine-protein phosphatase 2A regulatory subunit B'
MVQVNMCRSLPPLSSIHVVKTEDMEEFVEPAWPHLCVVFELLLRLVQSTEIVLPVKKKLVSAHLVSGVMNQFDAYVHTYPINRGRVCSSV